jgi:hypothetical protein
MIHYKGLWATDSLPPIILIIIIICNISGDGRVRNQELQH